MSSLYVVERLRSREGVNAGWAVCLRDGYVIGFAAAYTGRFAQCRARFRALRLNRRVIRAAR